MSSPSRVIMNAKNRIIARFSLIGREGGGGGGRRYIIKYLFYPALPYPTLFYSTLLYSILHTRVYLKKLVISRKKTHPFTLPCPRVTYLLCCMYCTYVCICACHCRVLIMLMLLGIVYRSVLMYLDVGNEKKKKKKLKIKIKVTPTHVLW